MQLTGCDKIVLSLLMYLSVVVVESAFSPIYSHTRPKKKTANTFVSMPQRSIFAASKESEQQFHQPPEELFLEDFGNGSASNSNNISGSVDHKLNLSPVFPVLPDEVPTLPSLNDYRKFALPCLGLWVSGPLLSLVDTAFVGLSGPASQSSQQLAALGPATTFFDGATYLFAFLNVATTNLYSSAQAKSGRESEEAESVVRTASRVALNCGFCVMVLLLAYCKPLIALYIGDQAASTPNLLNSASDYVKIRALSMPTSLLLGVVQASLLGAKDSVTPLIAILYSTVVNLVGDFLLVSRLKMGLQGAAVATLLAQWVATAALVRSARRKLVQNHNLGLLQRKIKKSVSGKSFLVFAAPVLTLILGKIAAFGFMTHAAAAVPGQPLPLASHQIILSLFFFVSPFLEVLSQTAQTFIPPYLAPANEYTKNMRQNVDVNYDPDKDLLVKKYLSSSHIVAKRLLGIGFVVAAVIASVASLVPAFLGGMVTTDTTVQQTLKPLGKYLWIGAFLTAPVAVSEGVLLARRELAFLASTYVISTALLPSALLRVKHLGGNVSQVWGCFAVFQLFRASCFVGKIWGGKWITSLRAQMKQRSEGQTSELTSSQLV